MKVGAVELDLDDDFGLIELSATGVDQLLLVAREKLRRKPYRMKGIDSYASRYRQEEILMGAFQYQINWYSGRIEFMDLRDYNNEYSNQNTIRRKQDVSEGNQYSSCSMGIFIGRIWIKVKGSTPLNTIYS